VEASGRRVYTWATADVPKLEREPFAADSNGIDQYIDVAAPVRWTDVARWYGALSRDRYEVTPALDSALATVVTTARTLDDSLRALHRWVAQDFRYVSLSLGIGGFQPRLPGAVLATRYGDCKDKATLFIAWPGVWGCAPIRCCSRARAGSRVTGHRSGVRPHDRGGGALRQLPVSRPDVGAHPVRLAPAVRAR